ncbi:hypothetical protein M2403_001676 [Rahnella sp. BIGb0603]|jgi:hypothetical protein|nr:hypothetical protein [Rahnella sp. BIGb0603]
MMCFSYFYNNLDITDQNTYLINLNFIVGNSIWGFYEIKVSDIIMG